MDLPEYQRLTSYSHTPGPGAELEKLLYPFQLSECVQGLIDPSQTILSVLARVEICRLLNTFARALVLLAAVRVPTQVRGELDPQVLVRPLLPLPADPR